jgi:hypothetical protein
MTRLICRAVLATTAALTVIVLHGQTTTAGLLDLDDLDDLAAVVLDDSTTQPDPAPTTITELLDRTTSIVRPIVDLGAVTHTLTQPLSTLPLPLPVVTPPGGGPAPAPPDVGTDIDIPLPPAVDPPIPGPDPQTGPPAPIDDVGGTPIAPIDDPGGAVGPEPAPGPEPPASPTIGATTTDSDRSASSPPSSRSVDREVGQPTPPAAATEAWNPVAGGRGGLPALALGVGVAAIAALAFVIAVVRRAINRRGQRTDEAVDREREPTGRAAAESRPPRRVPPVRASADVRTPRRVPPGRASADARPPRREPRSGVGGRPIDRAGRDRRVSRTPSARPARTNTQPTSGGRRQPGAVSGARRSITPPARRTTG